MKINTQLDIISYVSLVEQIAKGFFDSDGKYIPHYGHLNAMAQFYNNCYFTDGYKQVEPQTQIEYCEPIFLDPEFVKMFNEEIDCCKARSLSFGTAYNDALDLVNYQKSTFGFVHDAVEKIVASLTQYFSDDNIAALSQVASAMTDGKLDMTKLLFEHKYSKK